MDVTMDGLADRVTQLIDGQLVVEVNLGRRQFVGLEQQLAAPRITDALTHDLNRDGLPDVYLVTAEANMALVGDGVGYFRDETQELGLEDAGQGVSAELLDLDADGRQDLLLHNALGDVVFWAEPGGVYTRKDPTEIGSRTIGPVPLTPAAGPSSGSGGTTGTASGLISLGLLARTARPSAGGKVPPPQISLTQSLIDLLSGLFVNDDANEVDGLDIADGSLTGGDISTGSGDISFLSGNVGIGLPAGIPRLEVDGDVLVHGILSQDPTTRWVSIPGVEVHADSVSFTTEGNAFVSSNKGAIPLRLPDSATITRVIMDVSSASGVPIMTLRSGEIGDNLTTIHGSAQLVEGTVEIAGLSVQLDYETRRYFLIVEGGGSFGFRSVHVEYTVTTLAP
jgi:hypothetical protein